MMPALNKKNLESTGFNYSSGLLVSILLRYPEIVTISCDHHQQTISLKFLINKENDCFDIFKKKLIQAIDLFHKMEGRKACLCKIEKKEQELISIVITRDLKSITLGEMNLIIELIKDELGKYLITDENNMEEEELILQEEMINHMLSVIHSNGMEKNITAVRDDGRVLVFDR